MLVPAASDDAGSFVPLASPALPSVRGGLCGKRNRKRMEHSTENDIFGRIHCYHLLVLLKFI